VVNSATITVGEINGYSWIRICGKGDVFLAPKLKKFTEKLFSSNSEETTPKVVFDMEECTGMDSTFMGVVESEWKDQCESVQDSLKEWDPEKGEKKLPPSLILETHKTLGSLNEKNKNEFSNVIQAMEDEINPKSSVTDRDS